MTCSTRYTIIIAALLLCAIRSMAQSGIYVPKKAKIFFSGDTATMFSNVINHGKLGVGKKAVVNFKGKTWQNDPEARITDETNNGEGENGAGGQVHFNADTTRQFLDGGYNQATREGASFPNLYIDNNKGIELSGSTARVRNLLHFSKGLFYLKDNILVIGNGHPGSITGYGPDQYIVSGRMFDGGMLLRENVTASSGIVVFPLGTANRDYAPMAIKSYADRGDDFYAGVYDSVYDKGVTGRNLRNESVNKTWELGKLNRPGQDAVEIYLQHHLEDEGIIFKMNRQNAYISQYAQTSWDKGHPQHYPAIGFINSGPMLDIYGSNQRTFIGTIGSSSYFTKLTGKGDTLAETKLWFNAQRTDWSHVRVYWRTKPEINKRYFIVQRRLGNDTSFVAVDTINSKALGGISYTDLLYEMSDPNDFTGISYYRLMVVDYGGNISYSNIVPVGGRPAGYGLLVWPNPNRGRFFVGINGEAPVSRILIWNIVGQKIHEEKVNGRNIIEMRIRIPGSYVVGFMSTSGNIIDSKKILVPVIGY